jgi:hypothetical protein
MEDHMNGPLCRVCLAFVVAMAWTLAPQSAAQAQMAKQGTYSGWFGWHSIGQFTDLGKGNLFWVGEVSGAFANSAGSGFLHNTAVRCPAANLIFNGHGFASGECVVTDQDGDIAILTWSCDAKAGTRCDGPMEWVGGTGKYQGISGKNSFNAGFVGPGPGGYSLWKGEYKLP